MNASANTTPRSDLNAENAGVPLLFGPIPSRRLGRSLGVNNIPSKTCTYSCVYCQIGRTCSLGVKRKEFFTPGEIYRQAEAKIFELRMAKERVDYLTFVPDGEPTLDKNLGRTIEELGVFGIKIAVITNASLIWDRAVRRDLSKADWVSLKVDSVDERAWGRVNRAHGSLSLSAIKKGAVQFSHEYEGRLVTETMLVRGLNDSISLLRETADFIAELRPSKAYILAPTRPPAEEWVSLPYEERLDAAYQIYAERIETVELIVGIEGADFTFIADAERELLGILAVHPMRTGAVRDFLEKSGTNWKLIERLIAENMVRQVSHSGDSYLLKTLNTKK